MLEQRLAEMDVVYVTRYRVAEQFLPLIRELSANPPILFNNAGLHFLRETRVMLNQGVNELGIAQVQNTRERELAACRSADAVLCYTAEEHAVITSDLLEKKNLQLTPWVVEMHKSVAGFAERKGIAFLGNFAHKPNEEALLFLLKEVMPCLLAQHSHDITLIVFRSNTPEDFKKYTSANVNIEGYVEDIDDVYNIHHLFVAPLLSGAGIKGEVLESMAYGLPTILTDLAAEGIGVVHGLNTLIANNVDEWVESILNLYRDESQRTETSENQRVLARTKYSRQAGLKRFRSIFQSVGVSVLEAEIEVESQ